MRPGCGEHSDPPRSPLEQLARRFLAPPSQGLRGLRMDEALERRQLDARPGASARGHVPTVPRLCPHPAHLRPSHIAATGCRSRPHGARMVSDGLRECGPQASNLQVARSNRAGRAKKDGHFWAGGVSGRPPTVPELCPCRRVRNEGASRRLSSVRIRPAFAMRSSQPASNARWCSARIPRAVSATMRSSLPAGRVGRLVTRCLRIIVRPGRGVIVLPSFAMVLGRLGSLETEDTRQHGTPRSSIPVAMRGSVLTPARTIAQKRRGPPWWPP
jgi:hypothetical protein